MKVAFAGTPAFAATHLAGLLASPHRVVGVLTQPDRPAGRGRRLTPGPVKALAQQHGLPIRQPPSLRGPAAAEALADWQADVLVVVAYGLLLPPAVLERPPAGCVNVHASLLPRWRGAAPIQRAILAGDARTGISTMRMEAGLDTGPVFLRSPCPILEEDTAATLHDRLAGLGVTSLLQTLDGLAAGTLHAEPQDHARATHAPKITKAEAALDWHRPAVELHRQVRAFNPWPVAHCRLAEAVLRVWEAAVVPEANGDTPGRVLEATAAGITVAAGAGALRITRLQMPGGRPVTAREYLNAHRLPAGTVLGGTAA